MKGSPLHGAISSDDRWLVSRQFMNPTITLWDITTTKKIRDFAGLKGTLTTIQFSSDSQRIGARSAGGETMIWDRETAKVLKKMSDSKIKTMSLG